MFHVVLSALFALMAVSCGGPHYVDYFPYHDDGTPKPKVALIPVIDSSPSKLPWDVSLELSEGIYNELMNSGEIYVMVPQEIGPVWAKRDTIAFFGNDMTFCQEFRNADFIVAMEFIDQQMVASGPCNNLLSMRIRLKVLDVRCEKPRVVLYEIVKAEYLLAPNRSSDEYEEICWGNAGYNKTPCGILHQRMISNLTRRLNEVLWSAK